MIQLAAIVISYYPNVKDSILNIRKYIDDIDLLIIWENTPSQQRVQYRISLPEYKDKIRYFGTDKNEGIAYPINFALQWAIKNSFDFLLTMDQDSRWDNFPFYKSQIEKYISKEEIGIFSPVIYEVQKRETPELTYLRDAITSGTVYRLDMVKKIGMLREDYFIDAVDLEYCYWAKNNGWDTVKVGNAFLQQKFGNQTPVRFYKKIYHPANYTPIRIYYIIRNHIFLWSEYPNLSNFEKKRIIRVYIMGRFRDIILFENDKIKKLMALFKGILHGLLRLGLIKRKYL